MERRRARRTDTPGYPTAGEVLSDRREFLGMVAKIMAGAAMLSPMAALAGAPDEPEFPPLEGDVIAVEPPRTRGVVKMPDPPITGGVPKPPDPLPPGVPPMPDPPPDGDPPPVGCPPDPPVPPVTGGVAPVPEPYILGGIIAPPMDPE